ncbi:MAG TPA: DUF433 domain-containing protein [Tepidisphaeraceae bacterium]|jgi:uncharacterized protein (DUF433 family)|nr:DUF433 domain-containing protein [Tepidisphaeraceae bacterium]
MTLTDTWIPKAPPLREDPPGTVRVGNSRVTLDVFLGAYAQGLSVDEIAKEFDSLRVADIYAVIAYYLENRETVDAYLKERQRQGDALREHFEEKTSFAEMREKLLLRY